MKIKEKEFNVKIKFLSFLAFALLCASMQVVAMNKSVINQSSYKNMDFKNIDFNFVRRLADYHQILSFIKKGDVKGVEMKCKEPGFDVNFGAVTPLNFAIQEGQFEIVKILADNGAIFSDKSMEAFNSRQQQPVAKGKSKDIAAQEAEMMSKKEEEAKENLELENACPICLDAMDINSKDKDKVIQILDCNHKFHKKCIDGWFKDSGKWECPYCMQVAKKYKQKKEAEDKELVAIEKEKKELLGRVIEQPRVEHPIVVQPRVEHPIVVQPRVVPARRGPIINGVCLGDLIMPGQSFSMINGRIIIGGRDFTDEYNRRRTQMQ